MKRKAKIVFVILCYRETEDVIKLVSSLKEFESDIAIVIVNSYYDELSKNKIKNTASQYGCDFLNIENKGYGYGNNFGIEFVNNHFDYEFICVSNPDIKFNSLRLDILDSMLYGAIIAPEIITKNGKKQNPYYYFHSHLVSFFKNLGLNKQTKIFFYFAVVINKIYRKVLDAYYKNRFIPINIYACHGSCYFIGYEAINKLIPLYNEAMFLFNEEEHLAKKAKKHNVPTYLYKRLSVTHFEDRSSEGIQDKAFDYLCQSYKEYSKYWRK